MKARNKHGPVKRRTVSPKKKKLVGKLKARSRRSQNQGRKSRSPGKPRNKRTRIVHRSHFPDLEEPPSRTEIGLEFHIEDNSTNSDRRKSQNAVEKNSPEQQDSTPVKLKKKSKKKLRATFIRHRNLIEKSIADSKPGTSASSRLLRRSSRVCSQSKSMSTLPETTPEDAKNTENLSDCVLIEVVPEIIVIDDEDDDSNKMLNKANELLDQVLQASESMNDRTITEDLAATTEDNLNLSAASLESGELEDTIVEVVKDNEKNNKKIPKDDNLFYEDITASFVTQNDDILEYETIDSEESSLESGELEDTIVEADKDNEKNNKKIPQDNLFYEDITASFVTENDDIPEYETIDSEESSVQNRTVLSDDVEFISSTVLSKKERKKRKKQMKMQSADDSVIFVSELIAPKTSPIINTLEFIPLDNNNYQNSDGKKTSEASTKRTRRSGGFLEKLAQPFKKFKENLGLSYHVDSETPPGKVLQNDIAFTTAERKRNAIYNSNTYNPNKEKKGPGKRMVIVDGSNVAYAHSCNKGFSVKGIEIALQYFEKMGHEAKAVVPQHRLQKARSSDPELLESLHRDGKIVLTPCKNLPGKSTSCYDDRFILQLAVEFDAAVVSNDNYRDLLCENPAFKKVIETRVIGYTWCKDMFMLPKDPYGRSGPSLSVILNRT